MQSSCWELAILDILTDSSRPQADGETKQLTYEVKVLCKRTYLI